MIRQQAAEKHLDPALIAAVIYAETKFDPRSSAAGAVGLMQIMPQTAEFLARRSGATTFTIADLGTPAVNIAYGSYYLRYLLNEYHGNVIDALAAYNGGESNVDRWIADARAQGHALTVDDIPFPETRAYVRRCCRRSASTAEVRGAAVRLAAAAIWRSGGTWAERQSPSQCGPFLTRPPLR